MASRLTEVIVDCRNLDLLADFWCAVLGYHRTNEGEGWLTIRGPGPESSDQALRAQPQAPALSFVIVPEQKLSKNRLHVDITPVDRSQANEVARLESLGATRIDIGQGETTWTVMADPEGNEFCVMREIDLARG